MKAARLMFVCTAVLLAAAAVCPAAQDTVKPQWWGKAPGERPFVQGVVANVSATNIAVQTREGLKSFTVNDKTRVMVRGQKGTIADVKVGDPVVVKFRLVSNNVPLALGILVPKPGVSGEIVSIQGNVITVREFTRPVRAKALPAAPRAGKRRARPGVGATQPAPAPQPAPGVEKRIVVGTNTTYASRGYQGSLADLRVGYHIVRATGTMNGDELTADHIEFMPAVAKGTVTAIENGVITVKTVRQLTLQLAPSNATVVWVKPRVAPNKKGTLDDVKVGSPVDVGFHPTEGAPAPLLWVAVFTGM